MLINRKKSNIVGYVVIFLLCAAFVITCIMARPETNCLLVAEIIILIMFLYADSSLIQKKVLFVIKLIIDVAILIFGSFSDELAVIAVVCIFSVADSVVNKDKRTSIYIWLAYMIECELMGILSITGVITPESAVYTNFIQSVIVDILFVVIAVIAACTTEIKSIKLINTLTYAFSALIVLLVIGSMIFLNKSQRDYYSNTMDILNESEGECIITSALVENMAITMDGSSYVDGANLILDENTNSTCQIFTFKKTANDTYTFGINNTSLMMDVAGGSMENGTNVQLWEANNKLPQEWIITQSTNGNYIFTSECNNLNLDVDLSVSTSQINVMTYESNGNISQEFKINIPARNKFVWAYIRDSGSARGILAYKSLMGSTALMLVLSIAVIIYGVKKDNGKKEKSM